MPGDDVVVTMEGEENPLGSFFFSIVVRGKNLKARRIPLSEAIDAFIKRWTREEADKAPRVLVQDYIPKI